MPEIYVRPFPSAGGGRWQISSGGGLFPFWASNRQELFYETSDNKIMVLPYKVEASSFIPGKARLWSDTRLFDPGGPNLDLAPDGNRFVVFSPAEADPTAKASGHVTVVLNFFDELKRRIP